MDDWEQKEDWKLDDWGRREAWRVVEIGISKLEEILQKELSNAKVPGWMKIHLRVYDAIYCLYTDREVLDERPRLYEKCKEGVARLADILFSYLSQDFAGEELLREFLRGISRFNFGVKRLGHVFQPLSNRYIPVYNLPSLEAIRRDLFRDLVFNRALNNAKIYVRVREVFLSMVLSERNNEPIDRSLMMEITRIFVEMESYNQKLEPFVLNSTGIYYDSKASGWFLNESCSSFLKKVDDCVSNEKHIANSARFYLLPTSSEKLLKRVMESFVTYALRLFLRTHHEFFLESKEDDRLRMYTLFSKKLKCLELVAKKLKLYIINEGKILIKQTNGAIHKEPMEQLLIFHEKNLGLVEKGFQNHGSLLLALREAFDELFNFEVTGGSRAEFPQIFAKFCEYMLETWKKEREPFPEEKLGNVLKLICFVRDQDMFLEFFRKLMATRLIMTEKDCRFEKVILERLKPMTYKLGFMLEDMGSSEKLQGDFKAHLSENLGVDFSVQVLRDMAWPSFHEYKNMKLPYEMENCLAAFKNFYKIHKNPYAVLKPVPSMGRCTLIGTFDGCSLELETTTPQSCVLLLFNESERLSYKEIKEQLGIEDGDDDALKHLMYSLCSRYKVLTKEPNTKTVSPTDIFKFNSKFTSTAKVIQLLRHFVDGEKRVAESVNARVVKSVVNDRRYAIDAAILRIMKSRKELSYKQLMEICSDQLGETFKPHLKTIKQRIEDLMLRDYLERDANNRDLLKFLPGP